MATIRSYCGVVLVKNAAATGIAPNTITTTFTSVTGSWQTPAEVWDDGIDKYIFWNDLQGEITFFSLEVAPDPTVDEDIVAANYTTATSVSLFQGLKTSEATPVINPVITFSSCMYDFGVSSRKLKQIGDKFIMEGGTTYKILK